MIIVDNKYTVDRADALSHIVINFTLDKEYEKMIINLSYNPRLTPEEDALPIILNALEKYLPSDIPNCEYCESARENPYLENLITTSLTLEGKYIGAWHNKSNNQGIVISKDFSSLGYSKSEISRGDWELQLSLHSINCEVNIELKVSVE